MAPAAQGSEYLTSEVLLSANDLKNNRLLQAHSAVPRGLDALRGRRCA
jgi:hypothetical protein